MGSVPPGPTSRSCVRRPDGSVGLMRATKSGRKSLTHERRAAQQQRILDAVEELLADRAFRELTVEDVMATAGMARTTFYRYFPDLEAILLLGIESIAEEVRAASNLWLETSGDPDAALEESGIGLIEAYRRHGRLLLAFNDAAATAPQVEEAWRDSIDGFIDRAAKRITNLNRSGRTDVAHPRQTARALVLMTERYLLETFGRQTNVSTDVAVDTLLGIWRGALFGRHAQLSEPTAQTRG